MCSSCRQNSHEILKLGRAGDRRLASSVSHVEAYGWTCDGSGIVTLRPFAGGETPAYNLVLVSQLPGETSVRVASRPSNGKVIFLDPVSLGPMPLWQKDITLTTTYDIPECDYRHIKLAINMPGSHEAMKSEISYDDKGAKKPPKTRHEDLTHVFELP